MRRLSNRKAYNTVIKGPKAAKQEKRTHGQMHTQEEVATLLCRAHLKVDFTGFMGGCIATTLGETQTLPEEDIFMEAPNLYGSRQSLRSWQQRNVVAPR